LDKVGSNHSFAGASPSKAGQFSDLNSTESVPEVRIWLVERRAHQRPRRNRGERSAANSSPQKRCCGTCGNPRSL